MCYAVHPTNVLHPVLIVQRNFVEEVVIFVLLLFEVGNGVLHTCDLAFYMVLGCQVGHVCSYIGQLAQLAIFVVQEC